MTVIEAIAELDEEFAEMEPDAVITVAEAREILLMQKRLGLWIRALGESVHEIEVELGMSLP